MECLACESWGTVTGRSPEPTSPELTLCYEIERIGRSVWLCKLYHRQGGLRRPVISRTRVEGNRTEAHRVMDALYELQKIKEAG